MNKEGSLGSERGLDQTLFLAAAIPEINAVVERVSGSHTTQTPIWVSTVARVKQKGVN